MEYFTPATTFSIILVLTATIIVFVQPAKWAARREAKTFPGYRKMCRNKRRLLIRFHQLPFTELWVESPWQMAIRELCEKRSLTRFNLLIDELRSQGRDNPKVMISIVGIEIYLLLQRLPPQARPGKVVLIGPESYEANLGCQF